MITWERERERRKDKQRSVLEKSWNDIKMREVKKKNLGKRINKRSRKRVEVKIKMKGIQRKMKGI